MNDDLVKNSSFNFRGGVHWVQLGQMMARQAKFKEKMRDRAYSWFKIWVESWCEDCKTKRDSLLPVLQVVVSTTSTSSVTS